MIDLIQKLLMTGERAGGVRGCVISPCRKELVPVVAPDGKPGREGFSGGYRSGLRKGVGSASVFAQILATRMAVDH